MTTTILTEEQINKIRLNSLDEWVGTEEPWQIFAKHIEQAVLQSDEVQAWKKDAERYRWLLDQYPCNVADALGCAIPDVDMILDDAMEKRP